MPSLFPSAEKAAITGISFITIYADDYSKAFEFYQDILGLEKTHEMGRDACFFRLGGNQYGLHLQGVAKGHSAKPDASHATVVLATESAGALHQRLKLNGVKIVQDEPVDRGEGDFWFQFYDSAGNILEVLGGK